MDDLGDKPSIHDDCRRGIYYDQVVGHSLNNSARLDGPVFTTCQVAELPDEFGPLIAVAEDRVSCTADWATSWAGDT